MDLANMKAEKQGYSNFERFMILTIPVLFVIVLLGVLLALFDTDFRNRALGVGQRIPIVKNVLPKPMDKVDPIDDQTIRSINMTEKIEELEEELASLKVKLDEAADTKEANEAAIKELTDENEWLKQQTDEQQLEDEEYSAKITELAGMFAKMTPSKAAPIIQNMTNEEIVLLFSSMRSDDRVRIMEKMNPRIAAEAAMVLKDSKKAKDMQIAALQAKLDRNKEDSSKQVSSTLDMEQLSATFTAMEADSAGKLLIKMLDISPSKVLQILRSVNDVKRSAILTEMSKIDDKEAAAIMSKLMSDF